MINGVHRQTVSISRDTILIGSPAHNDKWRAESRIFFVDVLSIRNKSIYVYRKRKRKKETHQFATMSRPKMIQREKFEGSALIPRIARSKR